MQRIKLYNPETERRRWLFAGVMHEILLRQYPHGVVIEPSTNPMETSQVFALQGTEHLAVIDAGETVYGGSYLAISTSPESGINRRLNRILQLPDRIGKHRLKRVLFALATECPRLCLSKVDQVAKDLGDRGIQFEFWESKDVRQQIRAHLRIVCPAFETSHLMQLASRIKLSCSRSPEESKEHLGQSAYNCQEAEDDDDLDDLGTLFISYASEDRPFVDKLVSMLDEYAAKVWYAKREILVGDSITERINAALSEASALIAVLPRSSAKKPWVLRELNASLGRQLQSAGISVLPVMIEQCDLPPLLADIKCADFTRSFEVGFNELIAGLQGRGHGT